MYGPFFLSFVGPWAPGPAPYKRPGPGPGHVSAPARSLAIYGPGPSERYIHMSRIDLMSDGGLGGGAGKRVNF